MRPKSSLTALVLGFFAFSAAFAPPAFALLNDGPIDTGAACVPASHYTETDSVIFHTGLREDSFNGSPWLSFNCFYYIMTWILGMLPPNVLSSKQQIQQVQFGPSSAWEWNNHHIPGNAYFAHSWLYQHGYRQQFVTTSLAAGPVGVPGGNQWQRQGFKPGDIIMVPGSVPSWNLQSYVHVGVVTRTDGNGHVITTRQKVNPWTCVQDLSPEIFDNVYGGSGTIFEVWRRTSAPTSRPPNNGECPPGQYPAMKTPDGFVWCRHDPGWTRH